MTLFRILFYFLLTIVGIYSPSAQEITLEAFKTDTLDKVFLNKCIYRVYYQTEIKQDTSQNLPNRGLTLLQIGSKISISIIQIHLEMKQQEKKIIRLPRVK